MKKPSEWTPQEAWEEGCKAATKYIGAWVNLSVVTQVSASTMAYPLDPPERVSDGDLEWMASPDVEKWFAGRTVELMALELIERRKAEKEQGR